MRNLVLAVTVSLLAAPAIAGPFDGTWAMDRAHCSGVYQETQVRISGDSISFIETTCRLTNPTNLRDMPEAKLYDLACSGEGSTWSERTLIGKDDDNLLIYNRGFARSYSRC